VERVIKRTGWKPRTVTAERGYGEAAVEDDLHNLGIRNVLIPRRGRPSKARQDAERGRAFRRTVKWRTGCKGRISHLKRNSGWDRSLIDGTEGAQIWTAHGVFPHDLAKTRSDRLPVASGQPQWPNTHTPSPANQQPTHCRS
jgi:IS5 family transposase